MNGELRSSDLSVTLNGKRINNRINYRADFISPTKSCKGTLTGALDVANQGKLLIGEMTIEHNCGADSPKPATLSLRR